MIYPQQQQHFSLDFSAFTTFFTTFFLTAAMFFTPDYRMLDQYHLIN